MNKHTVKIVLGSNYGDEGKGLATHYFAQKAKSAGCSCLNVLYGGGSQRGHTVELKNGTRHVFHHIGSGFYDGADTFLDRGFMVNPMVFVKEATELGLFKNNTTKVYVHPKCRVVTPYDIFVNQIVENSRGDDRHGSCGCGIWETHRRYECVAGELHYGDMINLCESVLKKYFCNVRDYSINTLKNKYNIDFDSISDEYKELFYSEGLLDHYISDMKIMQQMTIKAAVGLYPFPKYDWIILEGSQGLALNGENKDLYPNVTVGDTGLKTPLRVCFNNIFDCDDIEVCYVTRSYFTRHGAGKFPTECNREDINPDIVDYTNEPNDYQGAIRYGKFDYDEMINRISNDYENAKTYLWKGLKFRMSIMFTHCNYNESVTKEPKGLPPIAFDYVYYSYTKYAEDIIVGTNRFENKDDDMKIHDMWGLNSPISSQGGIGIDWYKDDDTGTCILYVSSGKLHAKLHAVTDGSCDKREIVKSLLEKIAEEIMIDE